MSSVCATTKKTLSVFLMVFHYFWKLQVQDCNAKCFTDYFEEHKKPENVDADFLSYENIFNGSYEVVLQKVITRFIYLSR